MRKIIEVVRIGRKFKSHDQQVNSLFLSRFGERGLSDKKVMSGAFCPHCFVIKKRRLTSWKTKPFSMRRMNLQAA
jgi:hypothetical protein